jgi:hypothetical protein
MNTDINHKDRGHAALGASGAKRWMNCPGSIALTRDLPDVETDASKKGTAAHEIADAALKSRLPASHYLGTKTTGGIEVDAEMCESVQVYLDLCSRYMDAPWEYYIEREFTLDRLNPPADMFGTSDFTAINRAEQAMVVADYKNGYVYVDVIDNPQLRYYAFGALFSFSEPPPIKTIEVIIVQPNSYGDNIKRDVFTVADLVEWSIDLMDFAKATQAPNAPLRSGSWCEFCKARGLCPERARMAASAAQIDFEDMVSTDPVRMPAMVDFKLLTHEQLGALACKVDRFVDWAKDLKSYTHGLMEAGHEVPFNKLVPKRATEKWISKDEAAESLQDTYGLTAEQVFEAPTIKSPAQMRHVLAEIVKGRSNEKMSKKAAEEKAKGLLADYTIKESSGTNIAPVDDVRDAIVASVHSDFDALSDELLN